MTFGSRFCKKGHCIHTYFDVFSWDLDTMILGSSHTCDLNRCGVKGHLGVNDPPPGSSFLQKRSLYPHTLMYGLGHNDPWVESHIRPQEMWGQRSSRGQ